MSAPVRIEGMAFTDRRFKRLGQAVGYTRYDVMARMAELWSIATNNVRECVDIFDVGDVFEMDETLVVNAILKARLGGVCDCGLGDCLRLAGGGRLGYEGWCNTRSRVARSNGSKGGRPKKEPKKKPSRLSPETKRVSAAKPSSEKEHEPEHELENEPEHENEPMDPAAAKSLETTVRVIDYFNRRAGKSARPATHDERVRKLLKAGHTEREINVVVWHAVERWGKDPEMAQYITPVTLFRLKNAKGHAFPSYLEAAIPAYEKKTHKRFERVGGET